MKYRKFGDLDYEVSALGFGAMRLPTKGDDEGGIDEAEAIRMIRHAIDNGVNYVDTAWPYHKGNSEIVVGKALQEGYRERVKLATKLPIWEVEGPEDMDRVLDKQLEKLQTDRIDFYLFHCFTGDRWKEINRPWAYRWAERKKEEGRIGYIGFSFHDEYPLFAEIIDTYDWDFCQIQYNYVDTEFQAGRRGLKYAASRGIPVVIMEPLRGGSLADQLPKPVEKVFRESGIDRSPVDLALQWLWDQPEVTVVLSGMSTMEHVRQNIEHADKSGVGTLTDEEREVIERAAEYYKRLPVKCTACGYCVPCPNGVKIPENFLLYNEAHLFGSTDGYRSRYEEWDESERASACVECGQCEEECPQNLDIIDDLKEVASFFEG